MTGYQAGFEPAMRAALAEAAAGGADAPPAGLPASTGMSGAAEFPTAGLSAPLADVPVGAVLLDGSGVIIGRGRNLREAQSDPTAHAEIVAIRAAGAERGSWRLDECTLVVTLEPCTMCAGALLAGRLRRLVYGAADPRAGAAGSVWDVLHDPRLGPQVEVLGGVLADECAALLRAFFASRRHA